MKKINEELTIVISEENILAAEKLNEEQKVAYNVIFENVLAREAAVFFIDGPGGIGKMYLYSALLTTIRSKNLIALATTSSGVAAVILPGGRATIKFSLFIKINKNFIMG